MTYRSYGCSALCHCAQTVGHRSRPTTVIKTYTVFHKKPDPETSCYNFKKTALISKKCSYLSYSKCSKCCPLALTQALSRFLHWPMASSTIVCSKSAQTLTSRCFSSARSQIGFIRPMPNFSSTMNPQLNGSALCKK